MSLNPILARMRHLPLRRITSVLVILLVLLLLVGGLVLPWVARPRLESALTEALHRPVQIQNLTFNPFILRATLSGISVREQGQPVLSVGRITANLQLSSIWQRGPVLSELTVDHPVISLVRLAPQRYNWSDLLESKPTAPDADKGLPRFALYNIRLINGRIDFADKVSQRRDTIDGIQIGVPFISSLPVFVETEVEPHLAFRLDGAPFELNGKSTPFGTTRQSTLDLRVNDLDIPRYLAYLPAQAGWRLPAAKLDSNLQLVFREENHAPQLRLSGSATLRDVQLQDEAGQELASVNRLQANLADVRPLAGVYHLAGLTSDGLGLRVARGEHGALNWADAFVPAAPDQSAASKKARASAPAASAASAAPADHAQAMQLVIDKVQLQNSRVDWQDASVKPTVNLRLQPLTLEASNISNLAGKPAQINLRAQSADGQTLAQQITLTQSPLHITGQTELKNVPLTAAQPYAAPWINATLEQGKLSLQGQFDYTAGSSPHLQNVKVDLSQFRARLDQHKAGVLQFETLAVGPMDIDLAKARYGIGDVSWRNGSLAASRLQDGSFDWASLLRTPTTEDQSRLVARGVQNVKAQATPAPQISVGKVAVDGMSLRYMDESLKRLKPLLLAQIKLQAGPLQWPSAQAAAFSFSAQGPQGGLYDLGGEVSNAPWAGKIKIDIRNADVGYGQAYFTRWLNITLASAKLSAKGDLAFDTGKKVAASYRGNLRVNDLYALDKVSGDDFLKWKRLEINGIDARSQPLKVDVNEILLQNFYSRLVLYANGQLNLSDVVVKEGNAGSKGGQSLTASAPASLTASAPPPASVQRSSGAGKQAASAPVDSRPRAPLPPVHIKRITLVGGNINYTDNFIQPNYTVNLTEMAGSVNGLSSAAGTRAALDLHGNADHMAPVAVSGQLNPLADPLFLDITASVKGYNLAAASTYSAKYAGYGITKGKLSMEVHYQVDQRKLQAQNKLTLDQLTLGDQVDSASATHLPVKLALSLLTDRHGQINLDLPVSGSLDDPQFSVGGLIWKVVVNLLEKAVTAPFDLLASAFGGGSHASWAEFDAGSATLGPAARDDLNKLTQALADRPAIKLEISGWADPAVDAEGLKQAALLARLRAAKAQAMTAQGAMADDPDSLQITPTERPALLERVYKQAKFAKPHNVIGLNKSLPPDEMEKLLLANLPAGPDELRALANQRALAVKAQLEKAGVSADRIYLTQPRVDGGGDEPAKDHGPSTRAQFKVG